MDTPSSSNRGALPRALLSAVLLWGAASPLIAFWIRIPSLFADGLRQPQLTYIGFGIALAIAVLPLQLGERSRPVFAEIVRGLSFAAAIVLGTMAACFLADRLNGVPRLVPVIHFALLAAGTLVLAALDCFNLPRGSDDDDAPGVPQDLRRGDTRRTYTRTFSGFFFWDRTNPIRSSADWLAIIAFILLPWTTSGTAIALTLFVLLALFTLTRQQISENLAHPAVYLPICLWLVMALGMLWADSSWSDSLQALKPFSKLLVLPLFVMHFSHSERAIPAFGAFVVSCVALLIFSWLTWWWPALSSESQMPGIPVKDHIYQGANFVLAATILIHIALCAIRQRRFIEAGLLAIPIGLFVLNLVLVTVSRTTLVALPVLFALVGYLHFRFVGAAALVAVFLLACGASWVTSAHLQSRIASLIEIVFTHRHTNHPDELRLRFWNLSIQAIREAPLFGRGTGSTQRIFADARTIDGRQLSDVGSNNPHNQTFAVGIQTGLLGILILYLMWRSHLALFAGGGATSAAYFGLVITVQNIVNSIFNSHISDSSAGWLYVMAVGTLGGEVLRAHRSEALGVGPCAHTRSE